MRIVKKVTDLLLSSQLYFLLHRYDAHFLVKKLTDNPRLKRLDALPKNTQAFMTIRINQFLFLDSLSFLNSSLSTLVSDLAKDESHPWKILDQANLYPPNSKQKELLIKRKLVFCYEYCTSWEKMEKKIAFPPIEDFYSKLSNSNVSESDYTFAKKVYDTFHCESIAQLASFYCKTDTFHLAEVYMSFRRSMKKHYNLDCCHFISLPSFAYQAMLYMTKAKLSLLHNLEIIRMVKDNIRGK